MTHPTTDSHTDWHKDPRTWELVRMLIKCRDALPAITTVGMKLHNVPPDLDKQIERLIEPWAVAEGDDAVTEDHRTKDERCQHGIRWPHECRECADALVVPDGWCPICGNSDGTHKPGCQDGSEIL